MPPRNNNLPRLPSRSAPNSEAPKVMTWKRASLVLIVAAVFDLVRAFFQLFWFFGPALAAAYCTIVATDKLAAWTFGLLGAKTAALACTATAAAIGAAGVEAIAPIGVILAMAVGLIGFLTIGLLISMSNVRLFKTAASAPFQFAGAFAVGEVPFLGAFPVFTFIVWRLYRSQIRVEGAALKKWEEETAAMRLRERNQQIKMARQIQTSQQADAQQMQIIQEEERRYAEYQEAQAANEARYEIPEDGKTAA